MISNINLNKTEKTRFALKFFQEIRTETRISNFNLKGGLVRNIYVWGDIWGGGGDMFRIIYLKGGGVFCIIHRKFKFDGDIFFWGGGGGGLFRIIYLKGDVFRIFFLIGDFIQVNRFFILFT